jgi:cephalosporin hydroxylase
MRVLVCGGRDYDNWIKLQETLLRECDARCDDYDHLTIIQGGARGADSLAKDWARLQEVEMEEYPADWDQYGKAAGIIRNQEMLTEGKPDLVIAFPGGRGTAHMVRIAKDAGVEVIEVNG